MLDEALANPALHQFFVFLQGAAGVDHVGCARLIEAAKRETVPAHTFRGLSGGRALDELSATDFTNLVLAIARRDGGLEVALHVLRMRLFSKRADKKTIVVEDKNVGRALLGMVVFERAQQHDAHVLAAIVRDCLSSPADDALANQVCERLLSGVAQHRIHGSDLGEILVEMEATFPRAVLNNFVEKASFALGGRRNVFRGFREDGLGFLQSIPDDVLLEWAHERPETRFLQLAETMSTWQQNGSAPFKGSEFEVEPAAPLRWTSAALRVLREAPDPVAVLARFVENFHPRAWSGSLASILISRLPLLAELAQDTDPGIADAAAKALVSFKATIERTANEDALRRRDRDEHFEW